MRKVVRYILFVSIVDVQYSCAMYESAVAPAQASPLASSGAVQLEFGADVERAFRARLVGGPEDAPRAEADVRMSKREAFLSKMRQDKQSGHKQHGDWSSLQPAPRAVTVKVGESTAAYVNRNAQMDPEKRKELLFEREMFKSAIDLFVTMNLHNPTAPAWLVEALKRYQPLLKEGEKPLVSALKYVPYIEQLFKEKFAQKPILVPTKTKREQVVSHDTESEMLGGLYVTTVHSESEVVEPEVVVPRGKYSAEDALLSGEELSQKKAADMEKLALHLAEAGKPVDIDAQADLKAQDNELNSQLMAILGRLNAAVDAYTQAAFRSQLDAISPKRNEALKVKAEVEAKLSATPDDANILRVKKQIDAELKVYEGIVRRAGKAAEKSEHIKAGIISILEGEGVMKGGKIVSSKRPRLEQVQHRAVIVGALKAYEELIGKMMLTKDDMLIGKMMPSLTKDDIKWLSQYVHNPFFELI